MAQSLQSQESKEYTWFLARKSITHIEKFLCLLIKELGGRKRLVKWKDFKSQIRRIADRLEGVSRHLLVQLLLHNYLFVYSFIYFYHNSFSDPDIGQHRRNPDSILFILSLQLYIDERGPLSLHFSMLRLSKPFPYIRL